MLRQKSFTKKITRLPNTGNELDIITIHRYGTDMDISPSVRILATIKTGSVYYFEEEELTSNEPHFFVVLNRNPRTEEFLILVCASSQIERRKQIIQRLGFPQETLVFVLPSEYPIFSKDTVIDCNRVFEKTSQTLIEKLEQNKLKVCTEIMPDTILQKLTEGILASTQISKKVKRMLSDV